MDNREKHYTPMDLVVMGVLLLVVFSVAFPNLLQRYITNNESAVVRDLKAVSLGLQKFIGASVTSTYEVAQGMPVTLDWLSAQEPPYFDPFIGCAQSPCRGHGYGLNEIKLGDNNLTFVVTAYPLRYQVSGARSFCVTEDGIARFDPRGDEIPSHSACQKLSPVFP